VAVGVWLARLEDSGRLAFARIAAHKGKAQHLVSQR